jgi:uncharacterized membrane protein YGL010W
MTSSFFSRQLALYSTYHRDRRNRTTHFVGIPLIVFSLLVPAALWNVPIAGREVPVAFLVAFVGCVGWLALDGLIGLALMVLLVPMFLIAEWIATNHGPGLAWPVFLVCFVGGWILQFAGHAFEGRRPALMDNLFQAFIGPMFIMAEVLEALGVREKAT